jgi:thioredoxin 1
MADLEPRVGKGEATSPQLLEEPEFAGRVLEAEVPVILVFTAEWCAPCKWLKPYLDAIAREGRGRILVYVMDADRSPEIARRHGIASLPTSIFVREGREVERSHGVEPARLRAWAAPFLAGDEETTEA